MFPNYTKLPATIEKIRKQRLDAICNIIVWLENIGCNTRSSYHYNKNRKELRDRIERVTAFQIYVLHDNDHVEVGPLSSDPDGQMFLIDTPFEIEIEFDPELLKYITGEIDRFSNHRDPEMENISVEFDPWNRKIGIATLSHGVNLKLTYKLKFKISHGWGSTYKKGQKREISGYVD